MGFEANRRMNKIFALFAIVVVVLVTTSEANAAYQTLRITNDMANDDVTVDCYPYGNTMLGFGQAMEVTVRQDIVAQKKSEIFCYINTMFGFGTFAVYNTKISQDSCDKECRWFVRNEGLCIDAKQKHTANNGNNLLCGKSHYIKRKHDYANVLSKLSYRLINCI